MTQIPKAVDYDLIRKTLANTLEAVCLKRCQVMLEEQNDQNLRRPELPYFGFKITTPGARGGDDHYAYDDEGSTWNIGGQRTMTVSFNCYGRTAEEAYDLMALWQASLDLRGPQERLRRAGIAVQTIGGVADLSKLLNTGYEGRAQMDVRFGVASNLSEDPGVIETVVIEGDVDKLTEHETVEITVEKV